MLIAISRRCARAGPLPVARHLPFVARTERGLVATRDAAGACGRNARVDQRHNYQLDAGAPMTTPIAEAQRDAASVPDATPDWGDLGDWIIREAARRAERTLARLHGEPTPIPTSQPEDLS